MQKGIEQLKQKQYYQKNHDIHSKLNLQKNQECIDYSKSYKNGKVYNYLDESWVHSIEKYLFVWGFE